jgi:hypothetical protein
MLKKISNSIKTDVFPKIPQKKEVDGKKTKSP